MSGSARGPRVYLDWNATAPLRPQARAAVLAALDETGNASSLHAEGRRARAIVETARREVAALVGAQPHNVIFTSGATEAAAYALTPDWSGGSSPVDWLITSTIEHSCVLEGGRFPPDQVSRIGVTNAGTIDVSALDQQLINKPPTASRPILALMAANNETGIIQPVAQAAALVHAAGGLVLCDAVQMAGRLETTISALGADALLVSAHKLGGPKGIGALVLADERIAPAPLLKGGGQERRQRAGTENVAAIAGFGAAAKAALAGLVDAPRIQALRDRLEAALSGPQSCLDGTSDAMVRSAYARNSNNASRLVLAPSLNRLPNTTLLTMPGVSAQMLLMQLDLAGFAVSAGAACSSGKLPASHVLAAMGLPAVIAEGAIRVSLGDTTSADDIERFIAAWTKLEAARVPVHPMPASTQTPTSTPSLPAPGGWLPGGESSGASKEPCPHARSS